MLLSRWTPSVQAERHRLVYSKLVLWVIQQGLPIELQKASVEVTATSYLNPLISMKSKTYLQTDFKSSI